MTNIARTRAPDLNHHVNQGLAWLGESAAGVNTVALSYAAFEFRLAVERLGVHYWTQLLGRPLEEPDFQDLKSFRRIENRIYQLAGHQKEINAHFDFMRHVLRLLKIEKGYHTPDFGKLSNYWHTCSDLCHIEGSLIASMGDTQTMPTYFTKLKEISAALVEHLESAFGWPMIQDAGFGQLKSDFVAGRASPEDIELYLKKVGIFVVVKHNDGRPPEFLGQAIPPSPESDLPSS